MAAAMSRRRGGGLAEREPRGGWWKVAAVAVLAAGWLYLFLVGDGGWLDLRQQRQRLEQLEAEVERLAAVNDSLRVVLERMETDPAFLEKVAREDLGMVRPGESLYRIRRDEE